VDQPAVDVVLPVLDEARALPFVLSRMPSWALPIVADNGSTDGSPEVAAGYGARVVHVAQRGYGAACHAGLRAATADVVAFMDADASLDPADLATLLAAHAPGPVGAGRLVLGRRMPVARVAWPWHLRLANRELARRLRSRTGLRLNDIGPMRMADRRQLLVLGIRDRRSGYPLETAVRAAESGWRVSEVEVGYLPRVGRSKVTGTPVGALRAVRDMSRVLAR